MTPNIEISSTLLTSILATAPVGVLVVDAQTQRVILANEQYHQFLDAEWQQCDITGYKLSELIHGYDMSPLPAIIRQVAETGQSVRIADREYNGFARGTTYWSYDATPVRDMQGEGTAVLFTITEITEQVRARRELEETNAALTTLAAMSVTISTSLDLDEVMDFILSTIGPLIPYDRAMVLLGEEPNNLRIVAARLRQQQDALLLNLVLPQHGSLNGAVFRDAHARIVHDFHDPVEGKQEIFYPTTFDPNVRAAICVPLVARGAVIGTIYLASHVPMQYHEADLRRLELFAPQAASAVANALLYREVTLRATESETLSDVALTVAASLALPDVLHHILQKIAEVVGYDQALVALPDERAENLIVVSGQGDHFGQVVGTAIPVLHSIAGRAFSENRSVMIPNLANAPEWNWRERHLRSPRPDSDRALIAVPLVVREETVGVLMLVREIADGYSEGDLKRLIGFAAPIAVAVANSRLYEQVRNQVAELQRLNANLETANHHKSEFLATMSHELRTPLNAILGFTELLRDDLVPDPDKRRQCFDDIFSSAQHLLKLINDVLDIAKVEAGEMRLHCEVFAVATEIAETERFMAPLIAQHRQTLIVHVPPDLPPVYADRARVRQVVLNLLSNANKFTPATGCITIEVEALPTDMRIRVIDTGIGIAPEDMDKVFQEFRQIDSSLTREYGGTGLGLALSKRLIELQGGTISFQSEPGTGSTFTLLLPLAQVAASVSNR